MVHRVGSKSECGRVWGNANEEERCGRSQYRFVVNEEAVQNVVEYKYLDVLSRNMQKLYRVMVNYRAKVGARALCAWLRKCNIAIGEVKGESSMRLLEALVKSVLLYGAEVWGAVDRLIHLFKCSCEPPEPLCNGG